MTKYVQVLELVEACPAGDRPEPPSSVVVSSGAAVEPGGLAHSRTAAESRGRLDQQHELQENPQEEEDACALYGDGSEPR